MEEVLRRVEEMCNRAQDILNQLSLLDVQIYGFDPEVDDDLWEKATEDIHYASESLNETVAELAAFVEKYRKNNND